MGEIKGIFNIAMDIQTQRELADIENRIEGEAGHRRVAFSFGLTAEEVKKYIPWSKGTIGRTHYENEDELNEIKESLKWENMSKVFPVEE